MKKVIALLKERYSGKTINWNEKCRVNMELHTLGILNKSNESGVYFLFENTVYLVPARYSCKKICLEYKILGYDFSKIEKTDKTKEFFQ